MEGLLGHLTQGFFKQQPMLYLSYDVLSELEQYDVAEFTLGR